MTNKLLQNSNKARLAMFACLFIAQTGFTQILFSEDFDGISGSTAGGAGTYSFPTGWLKMNVDNVAPSPSVAYINEAWERREDFANNVADSAAFSTSWTDPVGQADDWMWTPAITLTGCDINMSWNALTYDPLYPDGYEVRIMVEPNIPTGTNGSIGNMVTNSTLLYSIGAENTTWTNRSVSLTSYAGQTVRIAFRNVSNDKFILLIDDILIENTSFAPTLVCAGDILLNTDAAVCGATITSAQFLSQIISSGGVPAPTITFTPSSGIFETGSTSVTVSANNGCGSAATCTFDVVVEDTEAPVPSVLLLEDVIAECSATLTAPTAVDNCAGTITGSTSTVFPITTPGTTIVSWTFDDGNGNIVTLQQNVILGDVTAPTVPILVDVIGECSAIVFSPTATDNCAGSIIGTTTTFFPITSLGTTVVTWTFDDGNGNVSTADQNVIIEDNTAPIVPVLSDITAECSATASAPSTTDNCSGTITGTTTTVFPITAPGTTVVTWIFDDGNGNTSTATQNVIVSLPDATVSVNGLTITALNTAANVTYQWVDCDNANAPIAGATTVSYTATSNGNYAVEVTDGGCTQTSICTSINNVGLIELDTYLMKVYPNPAANEVFIEMTEPGTMELRDANGKIVLSGTMNSGKNQINLETLFTGIYSIHMLTKTSMEISRIAISKQ
jgi:hypothetical protein